MSPPSSPLTSGPTRLLDLNFGLDLDLASTSLRLRLRFAFGFRFDFDSTSLRLRFDFDLATCLSSSASPPLSLLTLSDSPLQAFLFKLRPSFARSTGESSASTLPFPAEPLSLLSAPFFPLAPVRLSTLKLSSALLKTSSRSRQLPVRHGEFPCALFSSSPLKLSRLRLKTAPQDLDLCSAAELVSQSAVTLAVALGVDRPSSAVGPRCL